MHLLSHDEIADIENAARHFLTSGRSLHEISPSLFPLTTFKATVGKLKETLLNGLGFELLRGLPVSDYSSEFISAIFCGIGAHLGCARSQNAEGHLLGHVRDIGADVTDPNSRIYQTSERQTFHTDSSDVVGLLCLRAAKEGGQSLLVSVESIYNRMRTECPELLLKMFDPVATDRRGEVPEGQKPFFEIPVLSWHASYLTVIYQRQYIESAQRFDDAPRLTPVHRLALDKFDALANDPDLYLDMHLEPGDMQFVYNHSQLHDRTGFVDWPEPAQRRHLLRLWLSLAGDRPLPTSFKARYGSITIGDRGGIVTSKS